MNKKSLPKPFFFWTLITSLSTNRLYNLSRIQLWGIHITTLNLNLTVVVPTFLTVKLRNVEIIWFAMRTNIWSLAQCILILVHDQTLKMENTMIWACCCNVRFLFLFAITKFAFLFLHSLWLCFIWDFFPVTDWLQLLSSHLGLVRVCRNIGLVCVFFLIFEFLLLLFLFPLLFLLKSLSFFSFPRRASNSKTPQ